MIDLTLDELLVPDIPDYTPDFGQKITRTATNKGGLSTEEVAANVALPFKKQRPIVITETGTTTQIQYDCKLVLNSNTRIDVTLGNGAYVGCTVTVLNISAISHYVNLKEVESCLKLHWDGSAWVEEEQGGGATVVRGVLTAGLTQIALTSPKITTNSLISVYTSIFGISVLLVEAQPGVATITLPAQSVNMEVGITIN